MDKKNILIVGGSSGIGLELVKVLGDDRHGIYVGSRTADTLAEFPGVHHIPMDVAAEFAPRIRVNAIAPSLTDTPLAKSLLSSEEKRKASADRHPLKRIGTPQEIARSAAYLLSDAGSWITGQVLPIDGGMSSLRTFR